MLGTKQYKKLLHEKKPDWKKNDVHDYDLRGEGGMIWETSIATYT